MYTYTHLSMKICDAFSVAFRSPSLKQSPEEYHYDEQSVITSEIPWQHLMHSCILQPGDMQVRFYVL